ncbi:MAG: cyclic nucleotide-binding domain-containing protein [Nitrospinaceae bacterium]|jgi:CRP-like cAMP-binding protein|nr:cyclic nucleotide-binding domain-containing protein [Nitrospinaceae bacterium]MDP6658118.1 cyclic nucleotide-binding domain-containing protein [Nitrospinaceae bacterium]MDP7058220.1 cyclic nucleotide-binding domain-containing protein [Nitrospinaceae bacterium]|tara:strand:- start:3398 stop:3850 length:453 start_codon:yes stop_codon:yes gene_type:complete
MQELSKVKMFAGLNDEDLSTIQWVGEERTIGADAVVFAENSPGECFYVLLEGLVEIIVTNPVKKDPISLAKIMHHEVFWEFCLFDDSPRSATARTISKPRGLEFCREDILSLFKQKPRIGVVVMKNTGSILCVRLRSTDMGLRNSLLWSG